MFPQTLKSWDGLTLHTHSIKPKNGSTRAKIIVVHGFGDHTGALPYQNVMEYLTAQNFAVYSFDLRGHGQSEGHRMFIHAWDVLHRDLHAFIELVQRETPELPLFLLGLSMGGLIVLNYAEQHPAGIQGIVAVAPAVGEPGVPAAIKFLMPILSRVLPKASLNPGLDLTRISRDQAAVKAYTADPLFQAKTTPRLAAEVLTAIQTTRQNAPQLRLPILILHGTEDTIVPPNGSAEFFSQISSSDKKRITYPGAYHNLFIETNREQVFSDIVNWIEKHLEENTI
ncbi:MAG: alpha/beta hydrolase [Anaerolineales bacterium]